MKREEVRKILPEISDSQLEQIMSLHGGDITALKAKALSLEEDIRQKDERLKAFEEVDLEKLKKAEYERGISEGQKQLDAYKLQSAVDERIKSAGAKNNAAAKALLDLSSVCFEGGELKGLDEQLEQVKKENAYLFADSNKPSFTAPSSGFSAPTSAEFDKMGYFERVKLFNENPKLYEELTQN